MPVLVRRFPPMPVLVRRFPPMPVKPAAPNPPDGLCHLRISVNTAASVAIKAPLS